MTDLSLLRGDRYEYGFSQPERYSVKAPKGLSAEVVELISKAKGEPQWMLDFRLRALKVFYSKPMPTWGADLSQLNLDEIYYYIRPEGLGARDWSDVPDDIRATFDRLGIPEAERGAVFGRAERGASAAGTAGGGLGLHVAQSLLSAMGARAWITDDSPGCCMLVTLPRMASVAGGRGQAAPAYGPGRLPTAV